MIYEEVRGTLIPSEISRKSTPKDVIGEDSAICANINEVLSVGWGLGTFLAEDLVNAKSCGRGA